MPGKIIWQVTMSLDGFIAGPEGSLDWMFEFALEPSTEAAQTIESTGAILGGRHWWDIAKQKYKGLDGIYGGAWTGPVFIQTNRKPAKCESGNPLYASGDLRQTALLALESASGKNVAVFGANVAQQLIKYRLIDEILVHIVPLLLGGGTRLIERESIPETKLETATVTRSGQITNIGLIVLKD